MRRMVEMIDHAVLGYEPFFPVRLVVFPEFAHAAPIYETVAELHDRLAMPIPNDFTEMYHGKARQRGIFIQTGTFLESDPRWPGHVFNTTCLIGPDGILVEIPQDASLDSVGAAHQSARPARLRRADLSGRRDGNRADWSGNLL